MEAVAIDSSFDDDDCDSVFDSTGISSTVRTGSPMWLPFLLKYNYTIIIFFLNERVCRDIYQNQKRTGTRLGWYLSNKIKHHFHITTIHLNN